MYIVWVNQANLPASDYKISSDGFFVYLGKHYYKWGLYTRI